MQIKIFKITHTYSTDEQARYLQSNMGFVDMWNHVKILQNIAWDIDSSHGFYEDDTAYIMTKFFGAKLIIPTKTQKSNCWSLDLYENWEGGYANDRGGRSIPRDQTDAMMEKYNFYKQGIYSVMLTKFLEQHNLGEGDTYAHESLLIDNKIWDVLFKEGVYDREKFIAEQKTRPEFVKKYELEKQRIIIRK
jgi:hypothetical protein